MRLQPLRHQIGKQKRTQPTQLKFSPPAKGPDVELTMAIAFRDCDYYMAAMKQYGLGEEG